VDDPLWQQIKQKGRLDHFPVHWLESTESTNHLAMELGKAGAESGTVVVAETQTRGRGRLGKSWQSPKGSGLYFSMVTHSTLAPNELARITLATGLAVCMAIEQQGSLRPMIKWPNDLLLENRKFCGILCENFGPLGQGGSLVVIGIGINVNTPREAFSADLTEKATSLLIHQGRSMQRGALLQAVLLQLERALSQLEGGGFASILKQWCQRDVTLGKTTTWLRTDGRVVTGLSLGPDHDGLLQIRDRKGQVHEVLSGDLSLKT